MKVKFVPQNIELEIKTGQSVKEVADENGVFIKSICNGLPSCAECRVRVVEGEHNVLPPSTKELNLIGNGYFIDQRRLSCQLLCFGDVTIDLAEQVEKQKDSGPKRPQGSKKNEAEISRAVTGNLIEQDTELKEIANAQDSNEGQRQQQPRRDENRRPQGGQQRGGGQQQGQQNQRGGQQNQQRNNQQRQGRNRGGAREGQHQGQRDQRDSGRDRDNGREQRPNDRQEPRSENRPTNNDDRERKQPK